MFGARPHLHFLKTLAGPRWQRTLRIPLLVAAFVAPLFPSTSRAAERVVREGTHQEYSASLLGLRRTGFKVRMKAGVKAYLQRYDGLRIFLSSGPHPLHEHEVLSDGIQGHRLLVFVRAEASSARIATEW